MIVPSAIRKFIARVFRLRDSRTAKRKTHADIMRRIAALDPVPEFHTKPRPHQAVPFLLCVKYETYAVWLDMGGGKSKVALDVIAWRLARGDIAGAVVLVPLGSQILEWEDEAKIHQPGLRLFSLEGTPEEREAVLTSNADVLVCTYAGFLTIACRTEEYVKKGKRRRRFVLDDKMLRLLAKRFGLLVLDESHYLQTHDSTTARLVLRLRRLGLRFLLELTGSPFGSDPHALWTQFYLLDFGATLGRTIGLFRAVFFTVKKKYFGGKSYTFKRKLTPLLHRALWNRAIRYKESEFSNTPPVSGGLVGGGFMVKYAIIGDATLAYYDAARERLRATRGAPVEQESSWHQMRQLASGYMTAKGEDTGKVTIEFPENPKLDALEAFLAGLPRKAQALVFCYYRTTGELFSRELARRGFRNELILGGMGKTKRREAARRFKTGATRFLVANEALAYGGNYQMADYVVFVESPTSPIKRRQMEKRAPRGEKTTRTYIYEIVAKDTVDEKILAAHERGADLFVEVLEGRTRL